MQMGDSPGNAMGNLAVNGGVLAAGVGVFFVDQSVTAKLREQTKKEVLRLPCTLAGHSFSVAPVTKLIPSNRDESPAG